MYIVLLVPPMCTSLCSSSATEICLMKKYNSSIANYIIVLIMIYGICAHKYIDFNSVNVDDDKCVCTTPASSAACLLKIHFGPLLVNVCVVLCTHRDMKYQLEITQLNVCLFMLIEIHLNAFTLRHQFINHHAHSVSNKLNIYLL